MVLVRLTAARALLVAAIALGIATGVGLALVLALAGAVTALSTGHKPAQAGMLLTLAETPPSQLAAANAVWSGLDNGGFLVGSLLAGALVAATSTAAAMGARAATFGVAALTLLAVPHDPIPAHRTPLAGGRIASELVLGVRTVARDAGLRTVMACRRPPPPSTAPSTCSS